MIVGYGEWSSKRDRKKLINFLLHGSGYAVVNMCGRFWVSWGNAFCKQSYEEILSDKADPKKCLSAMFAPNDLENHLYYHEAIAKIPQEIMGSCSLRTPVWNGYKFSEPLVSEGMIQFTICYGEPYKSFLSEVAEGIQICGSSFNLHGKPTITDWDDAIELAEALPSRIFIMNYDGKPVKVSGSMNVFSFDDVGVRGILIRNKAEHAHQFSVLQKIWEREVLSQYFSGNDGLESLLKGMLPENFLN